VNRMCSKEPSCEEVAYHRSPPEHRSYVQHMQLVKAPAVARFVNVRVAID
jgi:hypothetical protein